MKQLQAQHFFEYMQADMLPGQFYDSVPWNYKKTETMILKQLDQWLAARDVDVIGITGPLTKDIHVCNGHCGGKGMQAVILYRERETAASSSM